MSNRNVIGLFPPPSRDVALHAISRALLRIRCNGWTCEALGGKIGVSKDTIENASNEKSMLSFESIALLAYHFPEEFTFIEALWNCRPTEQPTVADRLERIERELDAIRKEAV